MRSDAVVAAMQSTQNHWDGSSLEMGVTPYQSNGQHVTEAVLHAGLVRHAGNQAKELGHFVAHCSIGLHHPRRYLENFCKRRIEGISVFSQLLESVQQRVVYRPHWSADAGSLDSWGELPTHLRSRRNQQSREGGQPF
jgi:hypothetical protein